MFTHSYHRISMKACNSLRINNFLKLNIYIKATNKLVPSKQGTGTNQTNFKVIFLPLSKLYYSSVDLNRIIFRPLVLITKTGGSLGKFKPFFASYINLKPDYISGSNYFTWRNYLQPSIPASVYL